MLFLCPLPCGLDPYSSCFRSRGKYLFLRDHSWTSIQKISLPLRFLTEPCSSLHSRHKFLVIYLITWLLNLYLPTRLCIPWGRGLCLFCLLLHPQKHNAQHIAGLKYSLIDWMNGYFLLLLLSLELKRICTNMGSRGREVSSNFPQHFSSPLAPVTFRRELPSHVIPDWQISCENTHFSTYSSTLSLYLKAHTNAIFLLSRKLSFSLSFYKIVIKI